MSPVNYVGKPPAQTIEDDVTDIKTTVEDIQSASGSREETLTLYPVHGDEPTDLLANDPTTFKEAGTEITSDSFDEVFRFVVDTPEDGTRNVTSLAFELSWQTRVIAAGAASGETKWQIGSGDAPTVWRDLTDVLAASEDTEDHGRSGNFLPAEAGTIPFTIRLMGRVLISGDTLRTDILSTSKVKLTYQAI